MQKIYLDNAATTALDAPVLAAMMPFLTEQYGNASSTHSFGREARMAVEKARKSVAGLLNARPGEIFFTSCGTESSNCAIQCAVRDLGCRHIITSAIEHHATLHTVQFLASVGACTVSFVNLTHNGHIDLAHLEQLLSANTEKCLVSLMHANNELGNITDLETVSFLCKKYKVYFHTDAVQTIGHFAVDLQRVEVDFLSASAHKFHGPKGSGVLMIRQGTGIKPYLHGGGQERNMRAGTENVANIVGFATALELATAHLPEHRTYILSLKEEMIRLLSSHIPGVHFHGDLSVASLYTVLNCGFDTTDQSEMLSINLDIAGISVSGGSACSSGAEGGSHVIRAVYPQANRVPIRFSFSKHNTFAELERCCEKIKSLL